MKLLVTGGAGFIGSNFIRLILSQYPKYQVLNLDALTYAGHPENLADVEKNPNYRFVKGDITDAEFLAQFFANESFDACLNFAAESHVDRSILDANLFVKTNVLGTNLLLQACKQANIQRYIQISTDEVYGSLGSEGLFTEKTPLAPNSPYSASKTSADLFVRAYFETYQFPALITRCSNNYGPYQYPEKLIPLFILNAIKGQSVPVYGDGLNVRDWIYVDDHCRAVDTVLHHGKVGEVYNIGGNNERTNLEITRRILKQLGKPESLIQHVTDRLGHDRRYAIDNTKIKNELGWEPTVNFEEGLNRTIDWYCRNNAWIQSVISKN
jgi:dTDP-glucose 4,6-dehydratase